MTTLRQLISAIHSPGRTLSGIPACTVTSVTSDSRRAGPGSVFVALHGTKQDGHAYARQAMAQGCCAVVVEREIPAADNATVIRVADSHLAYGQMAAAFHGHPAREMMLIGLTGTNGKTTTSWIIEEMLRSEGRRTGVIGTVNYRYPDALGRTVVRDAPLTTPEPMALQGLLREMRDVGVTHVVMEVSSHALAQQRLVDLHFAVGVFTNLSRDHLDFHGSMEEYFAAKQLLFSELLKPDGIAVIVTGLAGSGEDPAGDWGRRLIATLRQQGFGEYHTKRQGRALLTCGLAEDCLIRAVNIEQGLHGFQADIQLRGERQHLRSHLIGSHNILNMLAAAGVGVGLGLSPAGITRGLQLVQQIPGRLERVDLPTNGDGAGRPRVFVDYAHTPDALENVLRTLRPVTSGRLFCVLGCGGDRDRGKRPMMGKTAGDLADRVIITADNPRSEDPALILSEIQEGVRQAGMEEATLADLLASDLSRKKYHVEPDRRQAIHGVCALAAGGDVVLIAGKGHETYQITAEGRRFFDDRLEARNAMLRWTTPNLVRATSGTLLQQAEALLLGEISTDTRTLQPGDIFLALKGENFDGHDFVRAAVAKGVAALIVSSPCQVNVGGVSVIRVADTLQAFAGLARYRRGALAPEIQVVAITGSSGKTTVKEMAAAIFKVQYAGPGNESVLKTRGNLNNLVGLPLTLLRVNAGHRAAVLEMGMNRPGEIQRLTEAADPDIGCITNIQAAHLEGLGSISGVARAKGELFAAMRQDAIRIVNCDDARIRALARQAKGRTVTFACTSAGRRFRPDIRVTRIVSLGEGGMRFTLHIRDWQQRLTVPATGVHNVSNCAAAAAIATAAAIAPDVIARGLVCYSSGDKRLRIEPLPGGLSVLNDAYNANPASMAAALRTVSTFGRNCRRVAVLGDMLELGQGAGEAHRQIGSLVADLGLDYLAVTGDFATVIAGAATTGGMDRGRVKVCTGTDEVARWLAGLIAQQKIRQGDWLLLKGSRGMRMERVLSSLIDLLTPHGN